MKYTKSILGIVAASFLFISCQNSSSNIESDEITTSQATDELTQDDLTSIIETLSISYPITTVNSDDTNETISSDEELEDYNKQSNRPKIEFPIEITVDGETVIINSIKELKALIGKRTHRKAHLGIVYPVTVINTDETTTEITDKEAMKAYIETLEEGTKPTFQFPISVKDKEGTITEVSDEEALEAYLQEKKGRNNNKPSIKRAPFKLVYPVTLINTDETTTEITDKDAMKLYMDSLEENTRPVFEFPISVEDKKGTVTELSSEDELEAYFKETKKRKK